MRLAWVIRYVADVAATAAFYQRAFGMEQRFAAGGDFVAMETGGTVLAFAREGFVTPQGIAFAPQRPEAPAQATEIAFEVADVASAHGRALAAGAIQVLAPGRKPWGQDVSYLRDPDGALVELCSPLPASEPA
jgi:catechol 2,3-dioxygenase-like lactoylglutathione lyase family enzyme